MFSIRVLYKICVNTIYNRYFVYSPNLCEYAGIKDPVIRSKFFLLKWLKSFLQIKILANYYVSRLIQISKKLKYKNGSSNIAKKKIDKILIMW